MTHDLADAIVQNMSSRSAPPRDAFLAELRQQTLSHLEQLARESAETLGRYAALPEIGPRIYLRLVEEFQMDGAQEIAACLVDLLAGALDHGTVMLTDREYRGLRLVRDEFGDALPEGPAVALDELVRSLAKTGR